ncbi:MAG: GvpL/GvpF family gas vesicle protein [Pseudorhodobacter sp.]|nr:GvpL/GvpF family gas vesicle protein [Pseudorhodobacter sp.]
MTRLYVYGIVGATRFADPLPQGHDAAPVFALVSGDLAVAVSCLERAAVEAAAANVWRHEKVLSALMARHAVLPVRFGTIAAGAAELLEGIGKRQGQLLKDLARLDGKVEIALRISAKQPEATAQVAGPAITRGTAYLQARQQSLCGTDATRLSVQEVRRAIRTGLDPLLVEAVWPTDEPQVLPIRASCLVKRADVARFVQAVDDIAARSSDTRVTCTGPWAPYSFVGQSGVAG